MFGSVKCVLLLCFALVSLGECKLKRNSRSPRNDFGKSSLAFVFDVTGSMQNDLRQLREGAEMILNTALKESNVIADFVFVPFHDPAVGPATVTRSKEVFKQALSAVRVYGGGDCPEKSLTGIQMALNVSRPRSFLYVFTDATAGDHRTIAKVLDEIQNKQSQVVFILTGHCNDLDKPSYKVYQQVAAASSGQIFNLKKASVHKMLEFVKSSIKGRTVNLASATNPAGYNFTQEIPVDSTLGEVTVSVSGAKPKITVVDPKGEQLEGPPKLVTTLDLSEIMVVKVMQPEMGNYLITVGSAEDYSVKVVGLSNLTFNHGFSVQAPKSMQETSYRPLKGAYNYLSISLTQTNVTVDIQYAEILTVEGKTLFEVPLKVVDGTKKVYAAEPFIPPDEFFYIAINGRDQYNQELRRIGTTAIQPKSPEVPSLTTPPKVEAHSHSRVVLTCNVESLVPVSAMWTKDASIVQEQTTSLQTTYLDLVIEDMREEHVGTYRCVARNVAGISRAVTDLSIIVDPPQVTIEPHNSTVEAGDDVTITCTVYSEALLLENKLVFNGTRTNYAIDLNKEPSLEGLYAYKKNIHVSENVTGKYSCVAANKGGKTEQSTQILIKRNPTAHILGPHTLSKLINSDLQLVCAVENANLIVWRAPNNTAVKSLVVNGAYNDVLDIRNVTSDGSWTCNALRGSTKGSDSVMVSVLIKPVVKIVGNKNITVLNGTVVEVSCLVVAKPEPRILWHRETEKNLKNTITVIKPTVYQSVLTLNSSAESVNGTYFCFGENTEGIHQDSIIVNVRRKMTLVQGFTDQNVQLYYQIELHCIVDSHPPGVTHWYHNGTSLVTNDNVQITEDNTTVYLMRVDFSNLGAYICEVENEYEKLEVKGTISVERLASPMLYKEPVRLTTSKGGSTIITCRILKGSPEPSISWQYSANGSFELSSTPKDVVVNNDRYELSIPKVTEEHAGVYRCLAHNVMGEDSYDVTLIVQYPPKLLKDTKESENPQAVKVGDRLKLSCEANGVPPPVTGWTKDIRFIVLDDKLSLTNTSELVIEAASANNSGTYTCNATNAVGSTHRNFTVVVYDPPTISPTPDPIREVLQGQLVELPCAAQGLPTPIVHWTLNNKPIGKEKYGDEYDLSFVANLTDSGEYTCTATNEHGNSSLTYTLQVWDPPKLLNNAKESNKPQVVKLGDRVKLACEASGVPPPVTLWSKDGHTLDFTNKSSLTNTSELVIEAASAHNSGTYTCNVTNAVGSTHRNFTLVVYDLPTISPTPDPTREVLQGQLVEQPCAAQGLPTPIVLWTLNGKPIGKEKYGDEYGLRFVANLTDSGEYTCAATNEHGNTSVSFILHVWDPPKFLNDTKGDDKPQAVKVGDRVKFSCEASGVPPPVTVWSKDGYTLDFTNKSSLTNTSELVIEAASANNSGTYTCNVTSAVGSTHRNFTLVVYDLPTITFSLAPTREVLQGQLVELPCAAQGLPTPIVHWTLNGKPIGKEKYENAYGLRFVANLTDSGEYTCAAVNEHGNTSVSFTLHVWVPPKFLNDTKGDNKPQAVKVGDKVRLTCEASGVPPPVTVWSKDGHTLGFTDMLYITNNSDLIIVSASTYDSGEYTCNVTNLVGSSHKNFNLAVYDPPKFLKGTKEENESQEVKVGEEVKLSCEASGVPTPVTVWTKDGRPFDFTDNLYLINGSELVIKTSSADNSGTYMCNVTSVVGSTHRNFTVVVYNPPTILSSLAPTREVLQGQLVELPCAAQGLPTPILHWTLNSKPIDKEKYVNNYGLRFVANLTDSGEYTCAATNEHGNTSVSFTLHVWDPPKFLNATKGNPQAVKLGDSVQLSCDARGVPPPVIVWTKDGHTLDFTDNLSVTNASDLEIESASTNNSGTYTCTVTNAAGSTQRNFALSVYDPPKLLEPTKQDSKPRKVKLGDSVKLSCEASGVPPPVTVWTKDGRPIGFTNKVYLTNTSELEIDAVSAYNSGTYTCNVTSLVGSAHRNFTLEVYDTPTILSPSVSLQEVLEGQLVELPCTAHGLPTPIVQWTQNGAPISHEKYVDKYGLRFVANLTDFGEYTCTATNVYGNTSISYTLHVWVPPYIKPHSSVMKEVLVGSNVTLQCDVIGFPLPTLQWKFNEELLEENTTDVSFNDVGNIYVTNTSFKHEGVYACVAHNCGGADELAMYLKVNEPPKILEDNYTGSYVATDMDTVLSVACRATGKPTPYYMWIKDDFYLNNDGRYSIDVDGTLHIKSPTEDMSGNYTCLARNSVGQDNKTVSVGIYSLPKYSQSEEELTTVTLEEGSDADIECPVRASSHSLKWYKNATLISTGPLRLYNVSRNNATTFFCVVTNAVGSTHSKVQLVVEWAPRFLEEGNRDIEGLRGDDSYFHCDVDAKPSAKTKWLFNSKPLVFEDKSYLKLINAQLRNAGTYKCIVSNVRGTVVKEFMLKVLEPPFISDFDMMDVQLKEGDNATLECNAKGTPPPAVTWTYNNSNWHVEGTSLSSANISAQSEGLYRCDAASRAGVTHLVYRVTVVWAARVREVVAYEHGEGTTVGNNLEVVHGSNVRIACKASGNPVPDIQWMRQGRATSENKYDIDYADLTLAGVDTSHKGLYTCVASNEGGSDDRRITLDVLEPPKIFKSLFEATHSSEVHLEVISGQSYYLHCHPYGNPFPEVYWFRDDVPLKLFDETMVSTEFGEVIVVKKALEEQSGNYTCVARNKVGNTSISYLVDVLVPPITAKESSRNVVATFGKQLVLECPSVGTRPIVMWIKHPYTELNADKRISFADDNFTMIINKTVVFDSGNYSCILMNKVGTTEVTFEVVVLKRPSIAGNVGANIVEGHVVPLRRSIVLKCEVDGHPLPQITWLKDTQPLSESVSNIQRVLGNSLLAIWSAEARDAGQYICLAENKAGSAHRRYNVAIQVPAKWSGWSAWSLCNVTCGLGHQTRSRLCHYIDNRNNTYDRSSNLETIVLDESACKGPSEDRRKCHLPPCEEDGSKPRWSQWARWSECSATCGSGSRVRTRKCKTKAKCVGDNVQVKKCTDLPSCSPVASSGDSDVFDSSEDISNSNPYMPDMTFESEPEVIDSHYSSDVEQFYSASDAQSPTAFFDVEVKENLDGSVQGPCDPGYRHNFSTNTCDDVDECTVENNRCHLTQVCVNTAGAYRCTCPAGYLSLAAGQRCLDINECTLETDGCDYSCVNTAGGYVCACPRHLRLHLDKHHCVIPALYRRPYGEIESEYMSTTIDFPIKYSKPYRKK